MYIQKPNEKIGPFGTMIEKDQTIDLLEQRLRQKFEEIIPKEPELPKISPTGIMEISFEDILRKMLAAKG